MRSERILGVLGMSFSEWREVTLSDISIGNKGNYGIGASAVEYSKDLYTYLRITDITDDGILKKDSLMSVDDEDSKNYLLEPNDIVFARTGNSTGRSYFYDGSDGELVYAGFLIKFSLDPSKVNPKFIRYYTLSNDYKDWVSSFSTGSTRGNINAKTYGNMKIKLPPTNQQDFLVNILSTIDEKIEVNNQINKTLENMAQTIFKQWFVDFEFPNEDGEPYKSSGGEMVESELGMIPKGWEVKKSSDIANVNIGKTPPRKEKECFTLDPDDYKWISIKDLGNSGAYIFDSSEYLTKESIEKYNVKVVPDNTVVLSFKLTIGRVSITCGQMTTNEAIAHFNLSNKSKITTEYLYLYLKGFDYGKLGNTSSIANAVNSKIIKSMPIIVPDNKTIKTFSEVMESVFSKIKYTIKQSDKLIEIRDSLLPKLMSGEIRVPLEDEGDAS